MIQLKDIQATAKTTIENASFFSGKSVFADVGLSRNEIEAALNTTGFCVVIDLPLGGKTFQRTQGVNQTYVLLPISVRVNPETNASTNGSNVSALEAVQEVALSLLAYSESDEADRFEIEDDAFDLTIDDAGILWYFLWFRKLVSL